LPEHLYAPPNPCHATSCKYYAGETDLPVYRRKEKARLLSIEMQGEKCGCTPSNPCRATSSICCGIDSRTKPILEETGLKNETGMFKHFEVQERELPLR